MNDDDLPAWDTPGTPVEPHPSLQRGIDQAANGQLEDHGSFAAYKDLWFCWDHMVIEPHRYTPRSFRCVECNHFFSSNRRAIYDNWKNYPISRALLRFLWRYIRNTPLNFCPHCIRDF